MIRKSILAMRIIIFTTILLGVAFPSIALLVMIFMWRFDGVVLLGSCIIGACSSVFLVLWLIHVNDIKNRMRGKDGTL